MYFFKWRIFLPFASLPLIFSFKTLLQLDFILVSPILLLYSFSSPIFVSFSTAENVVSAWMNEQEYQASFDVHYKSGNAQSISLQAKTVDREKISPVWELMKT